MCGINFVTHTKNLKLRELGFVVVEMNFVFSVTMQLTWVRTQKNDSIQNLIERKFQGKFEHLICYESECGGKRFKKVHIRTILCR